MQEGIVIAYRLIELSESWTPEISSFRVIIKSTFGLSYKKLFVSDVRYTFMSLQVGKVTQYDSKSNRIWLETVSEFPFDFRKKIDDLDDDATPAQYDPSPYQEDGFLEVM